MHEKNRHTKDGAINLTNYSALRISTHNLRVCDFTVLESTINTDIVIIVTAAAGGVPTMGTGRLTCVPLEEHSSGPGVNGVGLPLAGPPSKTSPHLISRRPQVVPRRGRFIRPVLPSAHSGR